MSQTSDVTKEDRNKASVLRYVEAFNRGDVEAVCAQFAPGAVLHGVLGMGGVAEFRPLFREIIDCFGVHLSVDSIIAEGDAVAVRYHETGTSKKPFLGGPDATGKSYELVAMEFFELRDGLIQRRFGVRDVASQVRQLGLPLP